MCVQYGGSEAHSTFFQRQRGDWEAATQSRDLMTSIRRFYSNAYTDAEKQDAINLFLGNFVPQHGHAALWELDSDYFLHAGMVSTGAVSYLLWLGHDRPADSSTILYGSYPVLHSMHDWNNQRGCMSGVAWSSAFVDRFVCNER